MKSLEVRIFPLAVLLALGGVACEESLLAPGVCPEFCPPGVLEVRDTVLSDAFIEDGFFVGYRLPHEARELQVAGGDSSVESAALIVFNRFSAIYSGGDTTVDRTIQGTDSFQIRIHLVRRHATAKGLVLALHWVPVSVDSTTQYNDIVPFFDDSTRVASVAVPDDFRFGTLSATVGSDAFPNYVADSFQVAVAVRLEGPEAAYVTLASSDSADIGTITRFVRVDSAGTRVTRTDQRVTGFHTFVLKPLPPAGPNTLRVGGAPAARALLRARIPASILDSTQIVRATLLLTPARPVLGAAGDTLRLRAHAISADLGPKSPLIQEDDTAAVGSARIPVGSTDTVAVDVTRVLNAWAANQNIPRALMLRIVPEAASVGTVDVHSLSSSSGRPVLRITYIPPFKLRS
ncbi:MAG: hypothetical protein KatS3mg081_0643 [Gemmatimonadales bacterium]|nr:MAG: hypothetical protein KatS3mg081_0643 [Gemmatimonadales bacterium]